MGNRNKMVDEEEMYKIEIGERLKGKKENEVEMEEIMVEKIKNEEWEMLKKKGKEEKKRWVKIERGKKKRRKVMVEKGEYNGEEKWWKK